MTTGFYFDERCLWHTTGEHVIVEPVGGYLQPPTGAGHAESPETKRRLKNLVEVSGLGDHLSWRRAAPLTRAEMERIHTPAYLDSFKALSDAGGGNAGHYSPFGKGSYEIATLSAGLALQMGDVISTGTPAGVGICFDPPRFLKSGDKVHAAI